MGNGVLGLWVSLYYLGSWWSGFIGFALPLLHVAFWYI